jgi:hypothetical protein
MDEWERLVRERLKELKETDPERAAQLERVLERLLESERKLEEMGKNDRRDESRMRSYGVID